MPRRAVDTEGQTAYAFHRGRNYVVGENTNNGGNCGEWSVPKVRPLTTEKRA